MFALTLSSVIYIYIFFFFTIFLFRFNLRISVSVLVILFLQLKLVSYYSSCQDNISNIHLMHYLFLFKICI